MAFFEHHGMDEKEFFRQLTLLNFNFPLHFHRAYELIIVNEGELLLTIDQKKYRLQKSNLAFIFSHQIHEFHTPHHSDLTIILFSPELIGHFFMKYKEYLPENNVIAYDQLPNLQSLDTIYSQKSFLYGVCDALLKQTNFVPIQYSTKTKILNKILLFVDQHFHQDCTLKTVAKHIGYDYAYLSKLFVQLTQMSYTEYLNRYRIFHACYLLKSSQQSVSEIAFNCGYNNLRSFNRNFKKIIGQSPQEYRKADTDQMLV